MMRFSLSPQSSSNSLTTGTGAARKLVAHYYLGLAYLQKKEYEKAIAEFKTVMESSGDAAAAAKDELDGGHLETVAALAYAYSLAGRRVEAESLLEKMIELSQRRYVSPLYLATVYKGLGEKDQALEQLNKAYENRHPSLVLIRIKPLFDGLRDDRRFQELLRRFEPIP